VDGQGFPLPNPVSSLRRPGLRKEKVSTDYYGGHYQPSAINSELTRPIELVHFAELEGESLTIVREWEKSL